MARRLATLSTGHQNRIAEQSVAQLRRLMPVLYVLVLFLLPTPEALQMEG
jgi:hypothetical protein